MTGHRTPPGAAAPAAVDTPTAHFLEHRVAPPIVMAAFGTAMGWLGRDRGNVMVATSLRVGLAAAVGALALTIMALGVRAFRRHETTIDPTRPGRASTLVTTGIFARTRNPMYVAMTTALLGWAMFLARWPALAGPVLFVLYITRFQIQPEEQALTALFGATYTAYCQRVRRWL